MSFLESTFKLSVAEQIVDIVNKITFFFRNLRSFIALYLTDTSLHQNADVIRSINEEALGSGLFEAFLESAPQLILQCSIILRTGNTCKIFLKHNIKYKLLQCNF